MKRLLAVLIATAALGGALLGAREMDADRARTVRREARRAAEAAAQRTADALAAQVSDLKIKAETAATNPRLVFALQENADEGTLRDVWRNEDWWRPWRTEFKICALAFTGQRLDVVEGIAATDLDAEALVRRARQKGEAVADIVVGHGWPYAATATTVTVPRRDTPPVLVLAKPIDPTVLRRLADKAGGAVALTDGRVTLADAGPEPERTLLKQAFGSETRAPFYESPDGAETPWAAALSPVAPGLWLWSYASGGAAAHDAEVTVAGRKRVLWVIALLAAVLSLAIGLRRGGVRPATPTGMMDIAGMAATGARATSPPGTGQGPAARGVTAGGASVGGAQSVTGVGATEIANPALALGGGSAAGSATFGRYTLLDRLGEGGMGEVFTAVTYGAEGFRRRFVVKRLRVELARDPAVVAQFIDEANLGSTLVHSNIVPVFDFGKVGDEYFLAQEYILGRDLARVTRRSIEREGRALGPAAVLHAAHETLRALEYSHTKTGEGGQAMGIVHRDVSPANVMVSARGEVKLFDFGIVKAEGRVTKTESGTVKGNVTFMSPEQARGLEVDARADLFSLGLVLYFCLTGEALYSGKTTYELLVKAATGPGPDELARVDRLPPPCAALLRRALSVEVGGRFQTAHEFLTAVLPHTAGGAAELATLMPRLFAEDFRAEEARFTAPIGSGPASGSGTSEVVARTKS